MHKIIPLILICLCIEAKSQCTVTIFPAPGFITITTDQTINAVAQPYWVCEGVTLNISSSPGTTYMLEQNATININGSDGDNVYAKPGCTINNYSPQTISYIADPATVTANNLGSGTLVLAATCTPVIYDYSMVGGSPCVGVTAGLENVDQNTLLQVYPNPIQVGSILHIADVSTGNKQIKIYDANGNLVICQNQVDICTEKFSPGAYILVFVNQESVTTTKFIVTN